MFISLKALNFHTPIIHLSIIDLHNSIIVVCIFQSLHILRIIDSIDTSDFFSNNMDGGYTKIHTYIHKTFSYRCKLVINDGLLRVEYIVR